MKITKILATALLTGSLAIGTVGIASAATTPEPPPAKPSQEQLCTRVHNVGLRLENLEERVLTHEQKLTTVRDHAAAEGKTDLVAKIDARLARLRERHDKIAARLNELHDKAQGRCDPAGSSATAPSTAA